MLKSKSFNFLQGHTSYKLEGVSLPVNCVQLLLNPLGTFSFCHQPPDKQAQTLQLSAVVHHSRFMFRHTVNLPQML
jgi:hypothetical protein